MVLCFPRPKMLSERTISGGVPSCNDAMYGSTQEETNYLNRSQKIDRTEFTRGVLFTLPYGSKQTPIHWMAETSSKMYKTNATSTKMDGCTMYKMYNMYQIQMEIICTEPSKAKPAPRVGYGSFPPRRYSDPGVFRVINHPSHHHLWCDFNHPQSFELCMALVSHIIHMIYLEKQSEM